MMLLLFHDVNIGFPLVLVLEAFYSVTKASVPISSPSSTSLSSDIPIFVNTYIDKILSYCVSEV